MAVLLIFSSLFFGLKNSHKPIRATAVETVKAIICPTVRSPEPDGAAATWDVSSLAIANPASTDSISKPIAISKSIRLFMSEASVANLAVWM